MQNAVISKIVCILLLSWSRYFFINCSTSTTDFELTKEKFNFYKQICADFGKVCQSIKKYKSHFPQNSCANKKKAGTYRPANRNGSNRFQVTRLHPDNADANPDANDGGWRTLKDDREAQPGPCSIEKISLSYLSQLEFIEDFAFTKPVVILDASKNEVFKNLTKFDNLLEHYGHTTIKLSSANSYSYERRVITFKDYCEKYLEPQSLKTLGNETFYFFGDNSNEDWFDLIYEYNYPPYFLPGHSPQLSFGVAGPGSGVPFHFHGPGFAETLWGRKRWFMYTPHLSPPFHPNRTTLQWLNEEYPKLKNDPNLFECTLNPGELIYFPNQWWHATLNIDTTVFMSTFLSP